MMSRDASSSSIHGSSLPKLMQPRPMRLTSVPVAPNVVYSTLEAPPAAIKSLLTAVSGRAEVGTVDRGFAAPVVTRCPAEQLPRFCHRERGRFAGERTGVGHLAEQRREQVGRLLPEVIVRSVAVDGLVAVDVDGQGPGDLVGEITDVDVRPVVARAAADGTLGVRGQVVDV